MMVFSYKTYVSLKEVEAKMIHARRGFISYFDFISNKMINREDREAQSGSGEDVHIKSDKLLQWKKENRQGLDKEKLGIKN